MENKILIGTLTECHADHLIISGVKIEVTERASVDQFPIGATLAETTRNVWANELWSWDITKLLGPTKWTYFYLYVMLDVFSRYVVGWMVAHRESATLAERVIRETCTRQRTSKAPSPATCPSSRPPSSSS